MFFVSPFFGQEETALTGDLKEHIVLNTDRDLYLSGETIWFNAFCFADESQTIPSESKVLYLELFSHESKSLYKLKIELNRGIASGAIKIPEETNSGNYFLSAYTHSQRNFKPLLFQIAVLTIVHPTKPLPPINEKNITKIQNYTTTPASGLPIEILSQSKKNNYQKREKVIFNLEIPELDNDDFANVSVAVVKKGTANRFPILESVEDDQIDFTIESLNYIPEFRDLSISGIIREKDSLRPLSNIQVYISVLGDNPQFHIYKTNKKGEFIFSLYQVAGEIDICLCTEKTDDSEIEILINNDFVLSYPDMPNFPLKIDTTQRKFLEEIFLNFQLSKQFLKQESTSWNPPEVPPFIFGDTYITVILDDFIPLPDLETVLKELVPPVKVKKRKGDFSVAVYHADRGLMFENPLVLVDNIVVFDMNELMNIHPSLIEKIEVIKETHQYGDYVLRGIVSITTNTKNFGGMKLPSGYIFAEYQTLSKSRDFIFPEFKLDEAKESPVPDFRNLLFWNPDLKIDSDGTSVSFYTGDHNSEYDIIIRGVCTNGELCFGKSSIIVNNE